MTEQVIISPSTTNITKTSFRACLKKWKRFSFKSYRSDLKRKQIYKYFILSFALIFLLEPLRSVFDEYIIDKIVSCTPQNSLIAESLLIILAGYTIYFLIDQFRKHLFFSPSSIMSLVLIIFFYHHFFGNTHYVFYKFSFLPQLAYADVVIGFILIRFSSYKSFFNPLNLNGSHLSFVEDTPSLTSYEDVFGYTAYAESLVKHINATTTKNSFAISVHGSWGTGKTDFLNRLRNNLSMPESDNIVIDFNPWRVGSDAIIEEFFKILSEALEPYNESITTNIKDYSKKILQSGDEIPFRILDTLLNELTGDDNSIKKQYENINEAVKLTGKRIIVLIDDLDRLTGKEVMEVLRIIRNTANFSNTFFVVGMDKEYTVQVMANANDFAFEEEYLEKIFQMTIILPVFNKVELVNYAKKILITPDMDEMEKQSITEMINKLSYFTTETSQSHSPTLHSGHIFESGLSTMRDLKRLVNSFKFTYQILKDNIEIRDLFVLEMIRAKDSGLYNLMRSGVLFMSFKNEQSIYEKIWDTYYEKTNKSSKDELQINGLKQAVNFLLNPYDKNERRFSDSKNHFLYFSFQHFNQIKLKEFYELLKQDSNTIYEQFKKWIDVGKGPELLVILRNINTFSNKEDLFKMAMVYLRIDSPSFSLSDKVDNLIFDNREENKKRYFEGNHAPLADFLTQVAHDKTIPNVTKSDLFHKFLTQEIYHPGNEVFDKTKLQEFLFEFLKENLETTKDVKTSISILRLIWESVDPDSRVVSLNGQSLEFLRDELLNDDDLFKEYIAQIIGPLFIPYEDVLTFSSFVGQIFDDFPKFLEKLKATSFADEDMNILKEEVENRIEDFVSGRQKSFIIENEQHKTAVESIMKKNGIKIKDEDNDPLSQF